MSDTEAARRQAEEDQRRDAQAQKANEQMIPDATLRDAYNGEIERQRNGG